MGRLRKKPQLRLRPRQKQQKKKMRMLKMSHQQRKAGMRTSTTTKWRWKLQVAKARVKAKARMARARATKNLKFLWEACLFRRPRMSSERISPNVARSWTFGCHLTTRVTRAESHSLNIQTRRRAKRLVHSMTQSTAAAGFACACLVMRPPKEKERKRAKMERARAKETRNLRSLWEDCHSPQRRRASRRISRSAARS